MALSPEQFNQNVARALPEVMLVHGDEPLQLREAVDAVRQAAQDQHYTERLRFVADEDFDWSVLAEHACAMSLFAERQLIDICLEKLPLRADAEHLMALIDNAGPSYSVLLHGRRLQKKNLSAAWAKAAIAKGPELLIWPPSAHALNGFIARRLQMAGYQASADAVNALVERIEGNLLAADNEITKMSLVYPPGPLSYEEVIDAVTDQSRYAIDDLYDTLASGDRARFIKVVYALQGEGQSAVPVINALARETRAILGHGVGAYYPQFVKQRWQSAARRLPAATWQVYLAQLAKLDAVAKGRGMQSGNIWRDLLRRSQPVLVWGRH